MIADTATPWVQHFLIPNTWICRRCGETLNTGESVYEGEIFKKDGGFLVGQQPPFRKFDVCHSSEKPNQP